MTPLQHYQLSFMLTAVVTTTVGLWVLIQKRGSSVAQFFCLYSLLVAFWSWCQAQGGSSNNPAVSLSWVRAMFSVVIAFPVLLTHLFAAFLRVDQRKVCLLGWLLTIGFLPFVYSDQFLRQGGPMGFLPSMPKAGPLFLPFNLVWFGWIIYDWLLLGRGPLNGTHPSREQVNLLLCAFVFGYITGCTNYLYLYGICIPLLQPLANYGVPIAFLVIAYGVFAYGLFDIQVVIRRSLVYSILVTSLTAGYFGLVYAIERIFRTMLGYHSVWLSLAAFGIMALAFQPLKTRIQHLVDWLIFRMPQEELVRRMERLEEQALQAEKFKAVSTLAAGMAHEIKNPLTALQTFGEYLPEKQNDPAFLKKLHEILTTETRRIHGIVQDLLDFAKPKPPQLKPVEIGSLITSTVNFLSADLAKHRIECKINCSHNGAIVQADLDQLRQVLINLIQNAADAMPEGGVITLSTQAADGHLELAVSDTGHGIPKELLPKIFDPFITSKEHGTGLGLAMVYAIVQAHHGTIRAESTPSRGATFTLRLPL